MLMLCLLYVLRVLRPIDVHLGPPLLHTISCLLKRLLGKKKKAANGVELRVNTSGQMRVVLKAYFRTVVMCSNERDNVKELTIGPQGGGLAFGLQLKHPPALSLSHCYQLLKHTA